jgi:hypothetical protein
MYEVMRSASAEGACWFVNVLNVRDFGGNRISAIKYFGPCYQSPD